MIDRYTKIVLTVIAASTTAIALQGLQPSPARALGDGCGDSYSPCHIKLDEPPCGGINNPCYVDFFSKFGGGFPVAVEK